MPDTISISQGNQNIDGRFSYRSRGAIEVEIISAFYPFRLSLTMFVPASHSANGLLGEEGVTSGRRLLQQLHRLCRFIEKNRELLTAGYREYETMIPKDGMTDWWLSLERKALETERSQGKIDDMQFQQSMQSFELQHHRYHLSLIALQNGFFEHLFPFSLEADLRRQVLEWLRWECAA